MSEPHMNDQHDSTPPDTNQPDTNETEGKQTSIYFGHIAHLRTFELTSGRASKSLFTLLRSTIMAPMFLMRVL